jgi:hypothetical protein
MVRAWGRRRALGYALAFAWLLGIYAAAPFAAQQASKPRPSPTPRQIILPPKLVAGAQATLAVLDGLGRLMSSIEVELPGGQKVRTDATGRAMFVAAGEPGALVATIFGFTVSASAEVVTSGDPGPKATSASAATGVRVSSYPRALAIHDRFTIEGSGFRAAADSNHVFLNGDPCLIVASSPVALVVLPGPHVPVGAVTLHVVSGGVDAGQFPVSAVLLEISGPSDAASVGSIGKLVVRARGTIEPLLVEVRNGSPGIIQLSMGNVQRVKTSGGQENIAPVEMKFVSDGNYSVTARLLPAERIRAR